MEGDILGPMILKISKMLESVSEIFPEKKD
jgi:hypothetical protein